MSTQQAPVENTEGEVVCVAVSESDTDPLEVDVDKDCGRVALSTLQAAHANATGLKYRHPVTNAFRLCSMSACGQWIQPPPLTGWSTAKQYIVLIRTDLTQNEATKTASSSSKRAGQQPAFLIRKRSKIREADAQSSDEEDSDHDQPTSNAASENQVAVISKLRDLLVLNLPPTTTDVEMREAFKIFGEVVTCEHKRDKNTNISRGFGFIRFASYDAQQAALNAGMVKIGENKCEVKMPFGYDKKPDSIVRHIQTNHMFDGDGQESRIFVGNLPKDICESEIRIGMTEIVRKLSPKCQVVKVFIPRPFRGYAFVTLDSGKVAAHLIQNRDLLLTFDGRQHKCFAHTAERSVWAGQRGGGQTSRLNVPQGYRLVHQSHFVQQQQATMFNPMQHVDWTGQATPSNTGYAGYNQ